MVNRKNTNYRLIEDMMEERNNQQQNDGTPTPQGGGTPTPQGVGTPTPQGEGTPTPQGGGTPTPRGEGTPTPQGGGTPTPQGEGTPTPQGGGTPTPQGGGTPTPQGGGTPTPQERLLLGENSFNPFGGQGKSQGNDGKYSSESSTKEKTKYSGLPTQLLQAWRERYKTEIASLKDQYDELTEKIEDLSEEKREAYSLSEERKTQKKLDRIREEREEKRLKLEPLEKDLSELSKELEERERKRRGNKDIRYGTGQDHTSEESESVTAHSLFANSDTIQKTVLYVATFFPELNPQDFKWVVSLLLEGKTKTIPVKESITTEEGKTQVKETQQEKLLTEIWQESFEQSDGYLQNCYLRVSRQNKIQGIDFTILSLRRDFLTYFEEQQPLYLEEQLQKTQKLDLLLDTSDDLARKAIDVAVRASVDYPSSYAEGWLIELLVKIAHKDEQRINPLLLRLSYLIYRLQIEPDYSRAEDIAQSFLERLMSPEHRTLAFEIVQDLMDKHLRSGALGIQPAKQLLTWLKKLLDQENWKDEEKDQKLQADVYSLLDKLLWQSGLYSYIYDFLEILKEWLPSADVPSEKYSMSNRVAVLLLSFYCNKTTDIWTNNLKWYGEWPSAYPLFAPLKSQDDSKFGSELNTLFSWLFHCTANGELALANVLEFFLEDFTPDSFNSLEYISYLIAEWLVILRGFDDLEPEKEVENLIEDMARSIISNTSHSQKSKLSNFWTSFTEKYLDQGAKSNQSGDRKLQKQFTARRKILRDFKKKFRALQKEMKAAK